MENNFYEKISNLRKNIKDLHNTLFNLYNKEKGIGSNKIMYVRRNIDNLSKAFFHVSKVNLKKAGIKDNRDNEEAKQLYSNILQGIDKLSKLLTIRTSEGMVENIYKDTTYKENLDNVRLAQSFIKALDPEMYLDDKEIERGRNE